MHSMESVYLGELRCESTHLKSGQVVITDAPPDNQGKGEAFSPTDLMCTSLAVCALTIMGIAARTHSIAMEGTKVHTTKVMAANPRRVGEIHLEFMMPHNYAEKDRKILEHAAMTCPVMLSLSADLKKDVKFNYPSA